MFGRSDLPFNRDASARFLPWIIGFMTYLCVIAVAAGLTVDRVAERWRQGLAGNLTVTGSVANIIVIEKAREDAPISFLDYMRAGVPVTLATLALGLLWLRYF